MKRCHQCQHDNPDGANFCNNCGSKLKMSQAERRQLTILFCDLVGSTPLSEQLDPEDYREVITGYHQVAEKVVKQYGGHIAQYLGDGLLVYFGYPKGLEDAPKAGVRAGMGILNAVAQANQKWEAAGKTSIKIRIGIHTGLVVVDDHLALGDTVNIAARLEGLAPHNSMVISSQTLSLVKGWFEVKSIGKQVLKGISEPMEVFQVFGETGVKTPLDVAKGSGLSPLVGRQKELDKLAELWQRAKSGEGQVVLLSGEAGIGKSRLMDAIASQNPQDPEILHLEARCSSYHISSAFHPLIELLEQVVLKFESGDSPEEKLIKLEAFVLQSRLDLKTAMPLFAEFLSIPSEEFPPLIISPFAKRQRTLEGLVQSFVNRASDQSILFTLEDLHWSDASTLEWLNLFLEQVPKHSIFMLCTTRPVFRPDWAKHSEVTQMNLERLTVENMMDICHYQTEGKALPKEILEQIVNKTEGVPLFVEELTKMIIESDFLVEKLDGFELAGSISSLEIPSTLQDSLLARLDRLSNVKDVVQMGAVLGREFSFQMLNAVLPRKVYYLEQSLAQLLEAEIFQQQSEGQRPVYQFKHAMIQETAYESLLKSRRQQLHHRVANVLEHQFAKITDTQPELLAHHYTKADQPLKAIPIWLQAGQLASKKNATAEAIAHLEMGAGLLPSIKEETKRKDIELDFLLTRGGASVVHYGFPHPKVGVIFNKAWEITRTAEVNPKLALVLFNLCGYYFNLDKTDSVRELLESISAFADDSEQGYLFNLIGQYSLGFSKVISGDFTQANHHLRQAIEIYNPTVPIPAELIPSGNIQIAARAWLMVCQQIMGFMDQAQANASLNLSLASEHEDSRTLYHINTFPSLLALGARDWEHAEKIINGYMPLAREFGDPIFTLTAEVYHQVARAFQKDRKAFDSAIHLINVCLDVGFKAFTITMSPYLGELYYIFGDYESGLAWTDKILNHVNETGSHIHTSELLRIKALLLQRLGHSDSTVEEILTRVLEQSGKRSAKTLELRTACDLARLWQRQGKIKKARNLIEEIYSWFTEGYDSVDLQEARDLLARLN